MERGERVPSPLSWVWKMVLPHSFEKYYGTSAPGQAPSKPWDFCEQDRVLPLGADTLMRQNR